MPQSPPTVPSARASCRIITSTRRRRQPSARSTPISRVRSLTLASMIFMIPIPPTSSEIAAIEPSTILYILFVCAA